MPSVAGTQQQQRVAALKSAFETKQLTEAQVLAQARTEGIALPADFFASTSTNAVASELGAPKQFAASDGASPTGGARQAELRIAASTTPAAQRAPRTLPNPAPTTIKVGRMVLKKLAQTPDMILYINYIKGRPTLVYVMNKLDPETALKANGSFAKDRRALLLADRDGVIKDSRFLNTPDKQEAQDVMQPSALEAAKLLDDANVGLALVTNQGGYEAGKMTFEDTIAINVRVSQQVANKGGHLDAIFICPFSSALTDERDGVVDARKPSSGMVLYAKQLAEKRGIKVLGMAGDQRTDGAAAQGAGVKFYAVTDEHGRWVDELATAQRKHEHLPELDKRSAVYQELPSFAAAVAVVLAE